LIVAAPVSYLKSGETFLEKDPDQRVQEAIILLFRKFVEMRSVTDQIRAAKRYSGFSSMVFNHPPPIRRYALRCKAGEAHTGAVTLIQRFGSAANLNIHLHCLVLDGVDRINREGAPVFEPARAPRVAALAALLVKIITRLMRRLTRQGYLVEAQGMTYLAEPDADDAVPALTPLQAASCTYRIALGPARDSRCLKLAPPAEHKRAIDTRPVRQPPRLQPSCGGALRRRSAQSPRTPVPHHHPPGRFLGSRLMNASSVTAPAKSCCN
jgi:Putative transposase